MERQHLEASALAAVQGPDAPMLQVSFPFPEIFLQVEEEVMGRFLQM